MSRVDPSQSTSDCASPVSQRPSTCQARIEGCKLPLKGEQKASNTRSISRKSFLPPLTMKPQNNQTASGNEISDSDTYRQKMWAGQANILVTVRLRPVLSHDRDRTEIVQVFENREVVVSKTSARFSARRNSIQHAKPRYASASSAQFYDLFRREKRYAFDYVFDPHDSQQKVYEHTTKFLIHGILNGFNATVFAYGCTGAGKTYTMLGTQNEPGIMARTLQDLFQSIERVQNHSAGRIRYRVTVSFLEIYNENIRDLLSAGSSCSSAANIPSSEFLDLREDPIQGIIVAGLMEVEANNARDVMKLLRRGNRYRSQESTAANAVSSRSHAVLQVHIEQEESGSGDNNIEVKVGKLSLVDLAGSERAAVTQNRGKRLLEGANINRSLLALGNCINALGEKGGSFVPYRDSKLTRLLKDSLGGNCRTVMIANVSLTVSSVEETLNTLKYANRAKNIKTTLKRNIVESDPTSNQAQIVASLRGEIATLKHALSRQEQVDISRNSPVKSMLRWTQNKKSTDVHFDNTIEETLVRTKLCEARQYITESFQQRRILRLALLRSEHQIRHCNASLMNNESQVQENTKILLNDSTTMSPTSSSILKAVETKSSNKKIDLGEETLRQQLARNERALEDFRRQIEQSPLLERHKLVREVLLMEYRIGNLEMDKMQLEILRNVEMNVKTDIDSDQSIEPLDITLIANNELKPPDFDLPRRKDDSKRLHLPLIKPNKVVNNGRGKFLDELREHINPLKCSRPRDKHEPAHTTAVSLSINSKPWGLYLNNASLSRIRLKKKKPVPLYIESAKSESVVDVVAFSKTPSIHTAPYLQSLKNRHKASQVHRQLKKK
ncbi:putative kinesin-like protein [Plasmopara halstedii]